MDTSFKKYHLISLPDENSVEEVSQFNGRLKSFLSEGSLPIIVNCENIEMIYSLGLGIIIDTYKRCNKEKILFAVVNINDAIQSVIKSTKLNTVINIYNTLEEYEISEFEDGLVGTRVPPLEFSYEEADYQGVKLFTCRGVMCEGSTMNALLISLESCATAIFNFKGLGFIDADCLDDFKTICNHTKIYLYGVNDVVMDELRTFEIIDQITLMSSLEGIKRALDT